MQYVCLIYQGTTPLPNSDEWNALSEEEQKQIYADYGALNKTPGLTPGPPLGLPDWKAFEDFKDGAGPKHHAGRILIGRDDPPVMNSVCKSERARKRERRG